VRQDRLHLKAIEFTSYRGRRSREEATGTPSVTPVGTQIPDEPKSIPVKTGGIYRIGANSEGTLQKEEGGRLHAAPPSDLATGSALGSVPQTVALSSAQSNFILTAPSAPSEETAQKKSAGGGGLTPHTL